MYPRDVSLWCACIIREFYIFPSHWNDAGKLLKLNFSPVGTSKSLPTLPWVTSQTNFNPYGAELILRNTKQNNNRTYPEHSASPGPLQPSYWFVHSSGNWRRWRQWAGVKARRFPSKTCLIQFVVIQKLWWKTHWNLSYASGRAHYISL